MSTTLATLEKQIARLQRALAELGPMRPGALGHQYKDPGKKRGGYWQISVSVSRAPSSACSRVR